MMPVFNAARFVQASLDNVLAQDFDDFEVLVYDDGSSDGTYDLIRERFTDPRIRLYRSARNRGIVYARNRILRLVQGDYLVPHDHDDLMLPGRFKQQARCLDKHPDVGVVVGKFRVTEANAVAEPRTITPGIEIETGTGWRCLRGRQGPGVAPIGTHHGARPIGTHHGATMIRRSVLLATGGYRLRWEGIEDSDLLYRLALQTRFYFLDALAFVYQRRPDSVTGHMRIQSERMGAVLGPQARRFRGVLRVADWPLEITSDSVRPLTVIREILAQDFDRGDSAPHGDLTLELGFHCRPRRWVDLGFDSQALFQLMRDGVTHRVHGSGASATAVIDPAQRVPDDMLYHAGFLHPLSYMLHQSDATLAHAALLARNSSGVLIMGESGCGKSTLSLALMRAGYSYFSDEHPILAREGDGIVGRVFASRIGVSGVSLRNFPDLKRSASWHERRRKWYLAPELVGKVGGTCRIDTVLFPAFRTGARFTARRVSPLRLLWRLQRDEYHVALGKLGERAFAAREAHLRLLLRLVRSATGFAITYGVADIARFPGLVELLLARAGQHAGRA